MHQEVVGTVVDLESICPSENHLFWNSFKSLLTNQDTFEDFAHMSKLFSSLINKCKACIYITRMIKSYWMSSISWETSTKTSNHFVKLPEAGKKGLVKDKKKWGRDRKKALLDQKSPTRNSLSCSASQGNAYLLLLSMSKLIRSGKVYWENCILTMR